MLITAANQTKTTRIAIHVDGEFHFTVDPFSWAESGLAVGSEIDETILHQLLANSHLSQAKKLALRLLSLRAYSVRDLYRRIVALYPKEIAEAIVDEMLDLGYLNDLEYADRWTAELYHSKGYGIRRIRQELTAKGIGPDLIEEVTEWIDRQEEPHRACTVIQKKIGPIANDKTRRRAAALLERYGYSTASIHMALHLEACNDNDETTEELL